MTPPNVLFYVWLDRLAHQLGPAAGELCCTTVFAGCRCRACRNATSPRLGRLMNEFDQSLVGVLSIAFLCGEPPRYD